MGNNQGKPVSFSDEGTHALYSPRSLLAQYQLPPIVRSDPIKALANVWASPQ
jgi:hypothetical protein